MNKPTAATNDSTVPSNSEPPQALPDPRGGSVMDDCEAVGLDLLLFPVISLETMFEENEQLPDGWMTGSVFIYAGERLPDEEAVAASGWDVCYYGFLMCEGPQQEPRGERLQHPVPAELYLALEESEWWFQINMTDATRLAMSQLEWGDRSRVVEGLA